MPVLRTIGTLMWEAHSPRAYKLVGREIYLARDHQGWFLAGADETGSFGCNVENRDAGAALMARVFNDIAKAG